MKKAFLVGCGALLALLLLVTGIVLVWGHQAGQAVQERFFAAVATGEPVAVSGLFHPSLAEEVDEPILAMWMEAMSERLGPYQGLSKKDFHTAKELVEAGMRSEFEGTALFAEGEARVRLVALSGELVQFEVESDAMRGWFHQPSSAFYTQQAETFLKALMNGWDEEAYEIMHPNLQEVMPLEKLRSEMAAVRAQAGKLQSIRLVGEEFHEVEGIPTLELTLEIQGDLEVAEAPVKFQFVGMKGHILGFRITFDDDGA